MASHTRKWVILIPILAGIAIFAVMKQRGKEPEQAPLQEKPRHVRFIPIPSATVVPIATGHGTVRPSNTWEGVAQVRGKILEKHPQLRKGAILEAGSLLLRIDPVDYELAIAQTMADIAATRAQLKELETQRVNTGASLRIEEASLVLSEKELQRKRRLVGKGSVSRSDLESEERALLAQQQSVQNQKNVLNLVPSQKASLEAQLARQQAQLSSTRRDLAHTEVQLPFAGRIAEINVEKDQYVREGEVLAIADGMAMAEVEVQIPIERMSSLLHSGQVVDILDFAYRELQEQLGLKAVVRLKEGNLSAEWEARFARISDTLDPKTRTIGVIIEVDNPYNNVQPGVRPPLLKGLFVEVVLSGKPRPDSLIVPRSALHDGKIYIANRENRLEIRPVQVELVQPGYAVIGSGLEADERLVVSDLIPAIEGMLLKASEDSRTKDALLGAAGRGSGQ
jgi:RND family efflux transporter MFP subunit